MKRSLFAGAAFLAAVMLPAGADAQGTIKIGVVLPYSGQFADGAKQVDEGIKLYMKQHGATVAGKKIEIITKDAGGHQSAGRQAAGGGIGRARQSRHSRWLAAYPECNRRLRRLG